MKKLILSYFLLLLLFPAFLFGKVKLETPEDALESVIRSTRAKNLREFLQCSDLQAFAGLSNNDENIDRILLSLEKDKLRKNYVNKTLDYLATHRFEILETIPGSSSTIFIIQEKSGTARAKLLFRKLGDNWKLAGFKHLPPAQPEQEK